MVFHKANKLSSNVTWVHSKTLNVIPFFWTEPFVAESLVNERGSTYFCAKWFLSSIRHNLNIER